MFDTKNLLLVSARRAKPNGQNSRSLTELPLKWKERDKKEERAEVDAYRYFLNSSTLSRLQSSLFAQRTPLATKSRYSLVDMVELW